MSIDSDQDSDIAITIDPAVGSTLAVPKSGLFRETVLAAVRTLQEHHTVDEPGTRGSSPGSVALAENHKTGTESTARLTSDRPFNTSGRSCDLFLMWHPDHGQVAAKRPRGAANHTEDYLRVSV